MGNLLNRKVAEVVPDRLVYDTKHPIDGTNVVIDLDGSSDGVLKRGQIIDYDGESCQVHAENGKVSYIVAADTLYSTEDTEVVVQVYTSGSFRLDACIADPVLTDTDLDNFRALGIYLK